LDELVERLKMTPENVVDECAKFGKKHNISDAKDFLK
jgi:hypothetical protein